MYKLKDTCNDGGGMDISNAGVKIGVQLGSAQSAVLWNILARKVCFYVFQKIVF